ncbi:uncharacterized protein LOC112568751 [Pomacea canaliculata]|uniref:uncharacterized protein LOC112568751 n=1 Tax=Pomacea canaliculata TaxID=400727 RepID=UPI000D73FDA9|nr:uncharacterized protein LOC112568751 [Pomacea canaliculata]
MAPLMGLTAVDSTVIVIIIIIIALSTSNIITVNEQENPLRQLSLEMPRDAVIVECRFSRTNLMVVNMSEKGNPANVFFQNKPEKCVRPHMFAHCQPTHDYVTIWAVVMNVTGTNRRTVFCNRTTDAGQYRTFESFNITLGEQVKHEPSKGCTSSSNKNSVSWVIILVVDAVVLQAVVSSHQRLSCE